METPMSFIHHLGVFASDFAASERFYTAALKPLGINAGYRADGVAEYWDPERDAPALSLERVENETATTRGMHIAFTAGSRDAVDAFHAAAVAAGGTSRHAPRLWNEYRAYCAFVSDPDGNNIEAPVMISAESAKSRGFGRDHQRRTGSNVLDATLERAYDARSHSECQSFGLGSRSRPIRAWRTARTSDRTPYWAGRRCSAAESSPRRTTVRRCGYRRRLSRRCCSAG